MHARDIQVFSNSENVLFRFVVQTAEENFVKIKDKENKTTTFDINMKEDDLLGCFKCKSSNNLLEFSSVDKDSGKTYACMFKSLLEHYKICYFCAKKLRKAFALKKPTENNELSSKSQDTTNKSKKKKKKVTAGTVVKKGLLPNQEIFVDNILRKPAPPESIIIKICNYTITKSDLETLMEQNWLNDRIINIYIFLTTQRNLRKVYGFDTYFFPQLLRGLRKEWTERIDIFEYDLIVIPVHLPSPGHWCICTVDFSAQTISYLDSMRNDNRACLDAVRNFIKDEHQDKKGVPINDRGWKYLMPKDIPQQMNGSDCGVFACTFAEFAARNAPYSFDQSDMPHLRRKMVLEIVTGKLLQ